VSRAAALALLWLCAAPMLAWAALPQPDASAQPTVPAAEASAAAEAPEAKTPAAPGGELPVRSGPVARVRVDGVINAASAAHIVESIDEAEEMRAAILLFELDTPGGIVNDTKIIIQAMLNSPVPVVVFVAPRGAWAGSAGTFITIAGHVAAMAPGTTIGAAHPVMPGANPRPGRDEDGKEQPADYGMEKAENLLASYIESVAKQRGRNVAWASRAVRESIAATAEEALELRVIDLVAEDRFDLLKKLEGRQVEVAGGPVKLSLRGQPVREIEMDAISRVFQVIFNPNIAALLMLAGLALLYLEFNQPGLVVPGVTGAICLVLALIAIEALPFSWTGVILCLVGAGLLIAEAFVPSFGVLLALGLGALLLGGFMLFDRPELSDLRIDFWSVLLPAVAGVGICTGLVAVSLGRTRRARQQSGSHELVGMRGVSATALQPEGKVFIRGEYWNARADEEIPAGVQVEGVSVARDGLRLTVKRAG